MSLFPVLFVSHGAPTLALEAGAVGTALHHLGKDLPRPASILVVSAHWGTQAPAVSRSEWPNTIYDFYGFPAELHTISYPAPGAPMLADAVLDALHQAHWPDAGTTPERGLDHGAWVPLLYLYPNADIPVTQLSIQHRHDPAHHYRLGQALRPLREKGVLVLASGSLTHNLFETEPAADAPPAPYVDRFRHWMVEHLRDRTIEDLLRYRTLAPDAERAHPDESHILPLFVALGAAGDHYRVQHVATGTMHHALAMDAFVFEEEGASGVKVSPLS